MFDLRSCLLLIPLLPLAASVVTAGIGGLIPPARPWAERLRRQSHWPCVLAVAGSCVLSLLILMTVAQGTTSVERYYTWFRAGEVDVGFTLRADALTAVMLVTVTFVGSLIVIYSAGYMHGDASYARYFAEIALFIFAMTGLVLADNFLVLYAFWEGVGLCSYLLIGFWFTKPSAAAAARKAFLVTRIGDVGLILGIILLWARFGHALDYDTVFTNAQLSREPGLLAAACLLLFCGAIGKSAQFPLHVWLPDAMEGPSPVSALIHAATMVTAGVYLVARCMPLFLAAPPWVLLIVAGVGAFTALLAAVIALTQTDLKRVLAYSTISQLGYMFLALGSGAATAAIFHLFTHAFFKALLFLAAGSVMHAMGNVIDMRRFGGLKRVLPITRWTFLCGAAALAGVPLLSGFWSKDEILMAVALNISKRGRHALVYSAYSEFYILFLFSGLATAFLTALYTFRAYFLTFEGEERTPPEAGMHPHESAKVMLVPMIVLAAGAVGAGIINAEPITHGLSTFLSGLPGFRSLTHHPDYVAILFEVGWQLNPVIMLLGSMLALAGIGAAWRMRGEESMIRFLSSMYQLSLNKFHFDELYDFFIVKPLAGFAEFCRIFDQYVVDSLVDLVGHVPRLLGQSLRPIQNGLVQFYALAMMAGLTVFLLALVWRLAG